MWIQEAYEKAEWIETPVTFDPQPVLHVEDFDGNPLVNKTAVAFPWNEPSF